MGEGQRVVLHCRMGKAWVATKPVVFALTQHSKSKIWVNVPLTWVLRSENVKCGLRTGKHSGLIQIPKQA